jgi:predicted ATPase
LSYRGGKGFTINLKTRPNKKPWSRTTKSEFKNGRDKMSYVIPINISDEVYNATLKLMNSSDKEIQPVFMRALTFYKFAKDVESVGGEINFRIKGEKVRRIKVP